MRCDMLEDVGDRCCEKCGAGVACSVSFDALSDSNFTRFFFGRLDGWVLSCGGIVCFWFWFWFWFWFFEIRVYDVDVFDA